MPDQMQEPLKVYELAKELGVDSFALLDKLKQINIEVKSHMSSLEVEQARLIREAFQKEKKPSGATKVVKKAAASGTTAAPAKKTAKKAGASDTEEAPAKTSTKTPVKAAKAAPAPEPEVAVEAPILH